jgi:hypothetical protein
LPGLLIFRSVGSLLQQHHLPGTILTRVFLAQSFTTCEVANPAKSLDFGADGYTASLTDWHELLQYTAPDAICGIVFVRGHFPSTPGAILARAQRRDDTGSKGTFGTQLQQAELDTDLELGYRRAQGWINLRWPYTQYDLKRADDKGEGGTYEEISFVRSGTVYQIIRIKWGHGSSLSDYDSTDTQEKQTIKLKIGGVVQFGCPCSIGGSVKDTFELSSTNSGTTLNCVSEKYQKRLELELSVNGVKQRVADPLRGLHNDSVPGTEVDVSSTHRFELSTDPLFIVSSYALRNADDNCKTADISDFSDLDDYLGIRNSSINMTDRLWTALCSSNYEENEGVESCVIGRCVEQILSVSAVPLISPMGDSQTAFSPETSDSQGKSSPEKPLESEYLEPCKCFSN